MQLGAMVMLKEDIDKEFENLTSYGLYTCQLNIWSWDNLTQEMADKVNAACKKYGVTITAVWAGWSKPRVWNFTEGPSTLGLVPAAYRHKRMDELKAICDFTCMLDGVEDIITHAGFLPENPSTTEYLDVVAAIKDVATYYKEKGKYFLFETGQETPVTLRRTIEMVGTGNLGINLDPANLILYGKGNPIDALDVFGEFVRNVHGKDGVYPTNGIQLGVHKPVGEGKVDYPRFIAKLKEIGYDGPITIEREIPEGEERNRDILNAKELLTKLINE